MTPAERRKLLERRKTLQTRKRIAGDKFPASAQNELDKIKRQIKEERDVRLQRTNLRPKPKSKKLNVDTSDVTLPKSKSGVSRLRMRKRAERDELIPKGATGPQPRGSDAPILAPRPKRKPPAPKKQAPPAPAMMFDAKSQQTTPDVGAMSQGMKKVKKAKKKSVGGGRGTMAGNKGFETMKEYFADDMSGRKSRVKTPFGIITIDSSDKGMAFEEYESKYGGQIKGTVKRRMGGKVRGFGKAMRGY